MNQLPITKKEFRQKTKISSSTFQRMMSSFGINTGRRNYLMPNEIENICLKTGIKI